MKKIFSILTTIFLLIANMTFSQTVTTENFDFAVGDSLTSHGYTAHSGGTTNPIVVKTGNLVYNGYAATGIGNHIQIINTGQDVNKTLAADVTSGTVYAAMVVSVDSARTGDYFFHFGPNPISTTFRARLFVKKAANGNLAFGLSKGSTNATVVPVYTDSIYAAGDTCLIVVAYQFFDGASNDSVKLWVNPTLGILEPQPLLTVGDATQTDINVGSYAFRQGTASSGPFLQLDGLRIGTKWSEVVKNFTLPELTIAEAREDLNLDGIPDRLGDTVLVRGIVISPNYQTTNHSYYIWDGTAGIDQFLPGTTNPALNLGDSVVSIGYINQYRGLTEIQLFGSNYCQVISSGNATPAPTLLTIAQYKANPEAYESTLIGFLSLSKVSTSTWPSAGSNATLKVTDGVDTLDYYIDLDTDVDNNPEPTWPRDLIGIAGQFSSSTSSYFNGYELIPRYYATDILPAGSIPVELTYFTATVSNKSVTLNWTTATETNNSGFDIERKSSSTGWQRITFVQGNGTTTQSNAYSFSDRNLTEGKYSYRLKQIDLNGTYEYSKVVDVNIVSSVVNQYELLQNYPNPFNPATTIKFNLADAGNVKLSVYNLLGQEVKIIANGFFEAGPHTIEFNASNLTSGIYLYKIEANGFVQTKKMTLLK